MLEDVVRKGRLLDIYGPLLTERQRRCMEMYFEMDDGAAAALYGNVF